MPDDSRFLPLRRRHDECVLERLEPKPQHADLVRRLDILDELDALDGPKAFAIVARSFGGPCAIAFLDGIEAARDFLGRFVVLGVPSIWHAGEIVGVDVFGLDLDDPETRSKVCDQPRGVWLRAMAGSDELVDPRQRPPVSGGTRAARRRDRETR